MNEVAITRTPEIIAGEIRTFTAAMLNNVIEIGRRMCEAKELLPHGQFGTWLKEQTGYSSSAANNFMRLYQEYGADQGSLFGAEVNCQTFGNLSYSKALLLLQVPREEREEVAVELDAEHLSTRELEKALRERDEAQALAGELRERLEEAEIKVGDLSAQAEAAEDRAGFLADKLDRAEDRVKELETRPVDVAVERDEEAIQKAAEEARKAVEEAKAAEIDKLKKKLEKAESAKAKAEQALKDAASAADDRREIAQREAEAAKAEAKDLRRQLRSAESGAGVAATLAGLAQQNFNGALEKIVTMKETHPDTADNLLGGLEQILGTLLERVRQARGT